MICKPIGKRFGLTIWDCEWQANGRRFHRRIRARTQAAALQEIGRLSGETAPRSRLTWKDGLLAYVLAKRRAGKTDASLLDCERCVIWIAERMPPEIDRGTLAGFSAALQEQAKASSPQNARKYRRNALAVCRWLRRQGLLREIPFEHAPPPEGAPKKRRALRPGEIPAYVKALPEWVRPPIMLSLVTTARASAVCGLSLKDISKDILTLREKRKKVREIPLDPVIRRVLADAKSWRKRIGLQDAPEAPCFTTKRGRRWKRRELLHRAQAAWNKAKLPHLTLHEIGRHTMGTMAGDAGWGVDAIRAYMGHADRSSSAGYVHTDEATAAKVRAGLYPAIVGFLWGEGAIRGISQSPSVADLTPLRCPKCGHKWLPRKAFTRKPKNTIA